MTKQRANYLYKFTGFIQTKYQRQKANQPYFYQLKVALTGTKLTKIFAFVKKTKPVVWKAIEEESYIGKKLLFHCRNYQGSYYLVDWEEIDE